MQTKIASGIVVKVHINMMKLNYKIYVSDTLKRNTTPARQ